MSDQLSFTSFDFGSVAKPKTKSKPKPKKTSEKIYSVSEFIDEVNLLLKPFEYIVQGEISRVDERGSAVYFTLNDSKEKAILNCIVWRAKINSFGITLKEGMEIKVIGSANIYKPSGRFSFMANYITPVGEGALKLAFEKLKKKLQEEGYFDIERKRKIPSFVKSVGLITSDSADAKKDFLTHLGEHGIKIYFHDARVEGIRSVDTIVDAVRWFNENTKDIEVLVITRGGGSLESLQAFNSEEVAKAIYSSRIPVISAVGHENDITIADLVADMRASTPTDAGKILSDDWNKAILRIDEIEQNIYSTFRMQCSEFRNELSRMQQNILTSYKKYLDLQKEKIDEIDRSLSSRFQEIIRQFKNITDRYILCFNQFTNKLIETKKQIISSEKMLHDVTARWYKFLHKFIDAQEKELSLSDPQIKLKQGYSITFDKNKKVIKSTEQIAIADTVTIKLHAGEISAQVEVIK